MARVTTPPKNTKMMSNAAIVLGTCSRAKMRMLGCSSRFRTKANAIGNMISLAK